MRVETKGARVHAVAKAVTVIMNAAEANNQEEFERLQRTTNQDDREFAATIGRALVDLADALLEPVIVAVRNSGPIDSGAI